MRKLLCADFSVSSRACQLARVQHLSFLSPISRERGRGKRNILKRNLQKRHGSYLTKIQPKQAQLGDYKCGGRSRAGSGSSSAAPPPRAALVVKGNKKGCCAEAAGWGPGPAAAAPRATAPGEPFGVSATGGGQQLFRGSLPQRPLPPCGRERRGLFASTVAPEHLAEPLCSLPCAAPEEMLHPGDPPPPIVLHRSFLRAFLKVNQGENCSRSCLEATRG